MTSSHSLPPDAGHNSKNMTITEKLAHEFEDLVARVKKFSASAEELETTIESDDEQNRQAEIAREAARLSRHIENYRMSAKEPFLEGGRQVDAFFHALKKKVDDEKGEIEVRASEYLRAKAREERRRREEQERLAREEAEAKLKAAAEAEAANRKARANTALEEAIDAQNAAIVASRAANASNADLARTKSDSGVTSTLRTRWEFEISELDKVPLEKLRPYFTRSEIEKAIRAYVAKGGRDLPGTRIFEQSVASFR